VTPLSIPKVANILSDNAYSISVVCPVRIPPRNVFVYSEAPRYAEGRDGPLTRGQEMHSHLAKFPDDSDMNSSVPETDVLTSFRDGLPSLFNSARLW
jgi:hypothetical protein